MSNDFINKIATDLQKSGNNDLAIKWSKLAEDAGLNAEIGNFARNLNAPLQTEEPKRVQHSYQVTVEGPENMSDITIMNSINESVNNIPDVTVRGYQFLFKKEI